MTLADLFSIALVGLDFHVTVNAFFVVGGAIAVIVWRAAHIIIGHHPRGGGPK